MEEEASIVRMTQELAFAKGRMTAEQVKELLSQDGGIRSVLDLAQQSIFAGIPLPSGLTYCHLPMISTADLDDETFEKLVNKIGDLPKPIIVHSGAVR